MHTAQAIADVSQITYAPYVELAKENIEAALDMLEWDLCAIPPRGHVPRYATARILAIQADAAGYGTLAQEIKAAGAAKKFAR